MPIKRITHIPILVRDQDAALAWFQDKFGFVVCDDNPELVPGYRWLTIAPDGAPSPRFILMLPQEENDDARIGTNSMCILACDDVKADCATLTERGVRVVDGPTEAASGTTATVLDLYGNPYYLVQLA